MLAIGPLQGERGAKRSRFWQVSLAVLVVLAVAPARASNPSSGTITDSNTTLTYTAGPFDVPNVTDSATGTPTCSATVPAEQCDTFGLTVNVAAGDATTKEISIAISFANSAGEFDNFEASHQLAFCIVQNLPVLGADQRCQAVFFLFH